MVLTSFFLMNKKEACKKIRFIRFLNVSLNFRDVYNNLFRDNKSILLYNLVTAFWLW